MSDGGRRRGGSGGWILLLALIVTMTIGVVVAINYRQDRPAGGGALTYERQGDPARTIVHDSTGAIVAVLTDGARTVVFRGQMRRIAEPQTTNAFVDTVAVVRFAPKPWRPGEESAKWFKEWFGAAASSHEPDLLALALQYQRGAPDQVDAKGVRVGGAAIYGPLVGGQRLESADFNDYLGLDWSFSDRTRRPARQEYRNAVDCSGYVRLVYGYRGGYPLTFAQSATGALPRRAVQMSVDGLGAQVIADDADRVGDFYRLQAGDLLFFDADPVDGTQIDHVGIYLGVDSEGRHRFISSRKAANGPTMGDVGGASSLDGGGLYARSFRSARRL